MQTDDYIRPVHIHLFCTLSNTNFMDILYYGYCKSLFSDLPEPISEQSGKTQVSNLGSGIPISCCSERK